MQAMAIVLRVDCRDDFSSNDLCMGIRPEINRSEAHGNAAARGLAESFLDKGLAFCDPEVSRDADAADAFRSALAIDPLCKVAKDHLLAIRRRLIPLAQDVKGAAKGLLRDDEHFRYFLSPFEMLKMNFANTEDRKYVQREKKRLLQEIELRNYLKTLIR